MKKIPIKQIAEELKVSIATVSRALNDHPRISDETKRRVFEVAERLEMFESSPLQAMIGRKSKHIAVVIPESSSWYFRTFLSSVRIVAEKLDFHILIVEYGSGNERMLEQIKYAYTLLVCGVIVYVPDSEDINFSSINKSMLPTVLFGNVTMKSPYPKLITDHFMETYLAVNHLFQIGCRKIVYIPNEEADYMTDTRVNGFMKAIEYYKITNDSKIVYGETIRNAPDEKLRHILESGLDVEAFIVEKGNMIPALLRFLNNNSYLVPSQIKVVALEEDELMQMLVPSITTVLTPISEIGRLSVEILNKLMESRKLSSRDSVLVIKPKLIMRNSSIR